jgi:hypothetical protein
MHISNTKTQAQGCAKVQQYLQSGQIIQMNVHQNQKACVIWS